MNRSPDWERVKAAAAAELEPGEQMSAIFAAMIPHEFSRGHVVAAELVPLLWLMDHARWRYRARAASRCAQVPLAPRMIIAVAGRRLVIWAASRRWRPGAVIGDLPRDRIIEITCTGEGTRSRLVVLHLSDGQTVALQVAAKNAADVARAMTRCGQ